MSSWRKSWIAAVSACWLATAATAWAETQNLGDNWPSRTLQMPMATSRGSAPVITAVCLQPGGPLLAAAGDNHHIYILDLTDNRLLHVLTGHADWVHAVAFSPNGRVLASAGHDGQVVLWDPVRGKQTRVLEQGQQAVTELAWSHEGTLLAATGFRSMLRLYDVTAPRVWKELPGPGSDLRAVTFSPDDAWLAAGGRTGTVRIWRLDDADHPVDYQPHSQRVRALAFSPDGRFLASSGEDRKIHVRVVGRGHGFDLPGRPAKVFSLAFFGPRHLAAGGSDNLIRLWDLSSGRQVGQLAGHLGSVASLDCNGNVLVSGSFDTTVRLWIIKERVAEASRQPKPLK